MDIDILVHYNNKDLNIQIKKESCRPEIGRMYKGMSRVDKNHKIKAYDIWYIVSQAYAYENP